MVCDDGDSGYDYTGSTWDSVFNDYLSNSCGSLGSGGGSGVNNCAGMPPCANELEEYDENCICAEVLQLNNTTGVLLTTVDAMKKIEKCLEIFSSELLSTEQRNMLVNNSWSISLSMYLDSNCSLESAEFAEFVIEALMNNNELEYEKLVQLYNDMDKPCQGSKIQDFTIKSNTSLTNLITGIFFGNDDYNLQISDIDIPVNIDANANIRLPSLPIFDSDNGIVIEFDNSYLNNATDLSIAMTSAHEFVHAYLVYLYIEGELINYDSSYTQLNSAFSIYYSNQTITNGIALGQAMHNVYDDFLDMITDSVFAYSTNNNIEGAAEEYCRKLVLGAHQYTSTFQALSPTAQTDYSNITVNENEGNENAKGTSCE